MAHASMPFSRLAAALVVLFASSAAIVALGAEQPAQPAAADSGLPIADKTVQAACSPCHKPDERGIMSRISFRRNTPEGWEGTIRRMVALNGVQLEPAT